MKKTVLSLLLILATLCALLWAMPAAAAAEDADICLLYDDRKELASLVDATGEVTISNEAVTSYKVGTQTPDDHVLVYQDGVIYAVGTGSATLTVGEKSYTVTVDPAPISLFLINGHSLSAGQSGSGAQSITIEAGQAYSSYHPNSIDVTKLDGYGLGWGSENRVACEETYDSRWDSHGQLDAFAPGEGGTTGVGSGIAQRWIQQTGEKIWVINIGVGGSTLSEWVPGGKGHNSRYNPNYYDQTIAKFTFAQKVLKNEYEAGHYITKNQVILYFPGANFGWYKLWSQETIQEHYELLWTSYQKDLFTVDIDGDGEADGIDALVSPAHWSSGFTSDDHAAVSYFATSEDYPGLVMVFNSLGKWKNEITTYGQVQSFPEQDYVTQNGVAPYIPDSIYHENNGGDSPNSLHCKAENTHLSQITNNAFGQEIGVSLYEYLRNNGGEAEVTAFELYDCNDTKLDVAFDNVAPKTVKIYEGQCLLLGSKILPVYVSNLTYELTGEGAELVWPLQVKGVAAGKSAKLTVKQGDTLLAEVNFEVLAAHTHCECGGTLADSHECGESLVYVPLQKSDLTDNAYSTADEEKDEAGNTVYVPSYTHVGNVLRGGNYFLTKDTSITSIYVASGETVNLCLNGYKLTSSERAFKPNGNLNICDCSEHGTGTVYSKATGNAPILYTYSGAQVKIYGGTYTAVAGKNREFAGLIGVYIDPGMTDYDADRDGVVDDPNLTRLASSMTIYGGTFYGTDLSCSDGKPTANGRGGCIVVGGSKSTLVVYDGVFYGANVVPAENGGKGGGSVISATNGSTYLYGGSYQGSDDPLGAIYYSKEVELSGKLTFANQGPDLYAGSGGMLKVGQLDPKTSIVLGAAKLDTAVVTLSDEAQAAQFTCQEGYEISQNGLSLSVSKVIVPVSTTYCVCGGTISQEVKNLSGHVCKNAEWAAWSLDYFTLGTKYYVQNETELYLYLEQDVLVNYPIEIPDGYTLHINLNGFKLGAGKALTSGLLRVYGNLTICDTSAEKTGLVEGIRGEGKEANTVYMLNYKEPNGYAPKFDLYSGTLTGYNVDGNGNRTYGSNGGVMQIGNNKINQDAVFNMYGGVIRDGAAETGGNIFLSQGTINMYAGLITGGTVVEGNGNDYYYGANIRMNSSTKLNMYGGTISNGTNEMAVGGNIFVNSKCQVKLLGGTIENGYAKTYGGNIYVAGGELELNGVKIIGGGAKYGGNIAAVAGEVTIRNSYIEDGMAGFAYERNATTGKLTTTDDKTTSGHGGNMYIMDGANVSVYTTTVSGGRAQRSDKSANGFGGNIYNGNVLYMEGCTITNGSGSYGGGVVAADTGDNASSTTLVECAFSGNSALAKGSSVSAYGSKNGHGATIEIISCTMDDSTYSASCGVIGTAVASGGTQTLTITLKDSTIINNDPAKSKSYGIYLAYGNLTLEGNVKVEADNMDIIHTKGTLTLGKDLIAADALSIYSTASDPIKLTDNVTASLELVDKPLTLDLNGYTLTGDVSGEEQFTLVDTATDDYTGTYGKLIGQVTAPMERTNTVADKNYLILAEENGYSAHRYAFALTHVSLDPANDALGYKAQLISDEAVLAATTEFGFHMGIVDGNSRTYAKAFDGDTTFTLRLKGIMAAGGGEMGICADAYVTIGDLTLTTSVEQTSMKDTILAVNELTGLSDTQKAAVYELYAANKEKMDAWFAADVVNNIATWAPTEE